MESDVYTAPFRRAGMNVIPPDKEECAFIHTLYTERLLRGRFDAETREDVFRVIDQMRARDRIDSVILAGTELPILLRNGPRADIVLLDTTQVHAEALLHALLAEESERQSRSFEGESRG